MRYSQMLIPTVKEVPADAEVPSHQLMIRAGFIRKLASGTYTYLPLGWRSLLKIINIVREEIDASGAQEILMPLLQPLELWEKTGRDVVFNEILFRFADHHGRLNTLSPTAEEVVTSLVADEIRSYKQLPINLYQICAKFRDEFRPRFGVLRSREFIMKDAYSFDATVEGLDESYKKMYDAYCRIFDRCGLTYVIVEAESGGMGGTDTEEFMVVCDTGEDILVLAEDGSCGANLTRAEVDPPAGTELGTGPSTELGTGPSTELGTGPSTELGTGKAGRDVPPMQEVHTPGTGSIEAVCGFLGTEPHEMIKTLIYRAGETTVAALVRGDHEINEGKLHNACGTGDVELADEQTIRQVSGADVGFAGPMGIAEKVGRLVIDHSVAAMAAGVSGANKTDYHVKNIVPGRDFPLEGENVVVGDIRTAVEGDTHGGKKLQFKRGIEIGHVFKLGTKYSEALGATFLDEQDNKKPCIMGCYGIGINRILAAAIEIGHDEGGCILPVNIAPFEVLVLPLGDSEAVAAEAQRIYDELIAAGADVLLDDRAARPGVKFKDADLIGIPLRVVVGQRGLEKGTVEIKRRKDAETVTVAAGDAVDEALRILAEMKKA